MMVKVFTPNEKGKIEFTRQELEKLLDEIYREGQKDCNCSKSWTWTTPYCNGSLTDGSATNVIFTTDNSTIDNFKADTTVNNKEVKPYSITTTLNATDAKEMSKCINEIIKNATARIDNDAFSKLAKELNF